MNANTEISKLDLSMYTYQMNFYSLAALASFPMGILHLYTLSIEDLTKKILIS